MISISVSACHLLSVALRLLSDSAIENLLPVRADWPSLQVFDQQTHNRRDGNHARRQVQPTQDMLAQSCVNGASPKRDVQMWFRDTARSGSVPVIGEHLGAERIVDRGSWIVTMYPVR